MNAGPIRSRATVAFFILLIGGLLAWTPSAAAQPVDTGVAVEACVSCHANGSFAQVANINDPWDMHYVDLDPAGPETPSTYRQLNIAITSVDVTGSRVVLEFTATDENGAGIGNLFDSDGRFAVAKLVPGAVFGDPVEWESLLTRERFTEVGGEFFNLGGGDYRYLSAWDPTTGLINAGDTIRLAIQLSASDLPDGNGWCDFDASLSAPNDCTSPVSLTRDIVQTETCNGCHGVTSDTRLVVHGARTEVEYCVVCHNPGLGDFDMTNMVHKIHYGANLTQGFDPFSDVNFTKDVDNCLTCHGGGGADEDNWKTEPNYTACESCHDDIDIANGVGHLQITSNSFCRNCHPPEGAITPALFPVATVHQGVARAAEGAFYRGGSNGFSIDALSHDLDTGLLTVDFSVTRNGQKMNLATDPRWKNGARLSLAVAWSAEEYTNEGSGSSPAPAQPLAFNALDVGGTVTDLGGGNYRRVIDLSSTGFGNVTVGLEGHPQANLLGDGTWVRIPVKDAWETVNIEKRGVRETRRRVIDIDKCNACHDSSGAGLSLHGDNRSSEDQVCVLCHNPDATDLRQRPADPAMALDGKAEESIDFKRMIHGIHSGAELANGLVIYGFGGNPADFSGVEFIGNRRNCLTCHLPGTYGVDAAANTLASTIDSGVDVTDPFDDLNISPVAATCSSCHDDVIARNHMLLGGASFAALDENIVVPEPGLGLSLLVGGGALGLWGRRRRRGER